MPNWTCGDLEISGKQKDLKRFCKEYLEPCQEPWYKNVSDKIIIDKDGVRCDRTMYFKDSCRGFIDNVDGKFNKKDDDIIKLIFDYRQAWAVDAQDFIKPSKKYNLEFYTNSEEPGMCFEQEIHVSNGEILVDESFDM